MSAIVGPAGLGKTFAIDYAIGARSEPVVQLTFEARPTMRVVADRRSATGRRHSARSPRPSSSCASASAPARSTRFPRRRPATGCRTRTVAVRSFRPSKGCALLILVQRTNASSACSLGCKPVLSKRAGCRSPADGVVDAGVVVELDDEGQRRPGLSDPRNAEVRLLAGGCRPTLRPAALPVAEQRSRAGAVTRVGVGEPRPIAAAR
jgi:hypothetical protein